jgi:simple sugar transport system permease protein
MLGGAFWAALPACLKAFRGTSEVIVSLLLNYVAINIVSWVVSGPLMEVGAPYPYSPAIPDTAKMPRLLPGTDAHWGVVVGILLAIAVYFVFRRTVIGLSLVVVGENQKAGDLAGIPVRSRLMGAMIVGGAFAGLAGTYEVLGLKHRLFHLFAGGYGYDGIVVAFLANGSPLGSIAAALFLAGMRSGANNMQRAVGVPTTVVEAIQGLILVFVAISIALKLRNPGPSRALKMRDAGSDTASQAEGI